MHNYQKELFPYAYNILGSAEDAKDAIQDVVLKYTVKDIQPENERNYLIRGVINQSINIKRRKKRFQSGDSWLPEPVATETSDFRLELNELVSYSLLLLLEKLGPKERAVFILKEAFAYTHEEIADVLSITVESSRKLLSRANKKLQQIEAKKFPSKDVRDQFASLDKLITAIRHKDLDAVHQLLSGDITFFADGGKHVQVVSKYCAGRDEVARLLVFVHEKYQANQTVKPALINHQPALLFFDEEKLMVCQVFEFEEDGFGIRRIHSVIDPEKLKNLQTH